jgi:NAD(P)H-dependent FMN reductase
MKILAINGSYHSEGTINTLIDRAIDGLESVIPEVEVEKIHLIDKRIEYCKGCMVCRNDDPAKAIATCVIDDDMQEIYIKLDEADGYIFGNPIFMGTVTGIMKTFFERFCWVLSKPGRWPIKGCPTPRTQRKKAAILIMSAGIVPTWMRRFCDDATKFFRGSLPCMLNAKISGTLYAGSVGMNNARSVRYFSKATALGNKIGQVLLRLQEQ